MATYNLQLEKIPTDASSREIWLQHAAELIVFEDARQYAIDQIDATLKDDVKAKIIQGIDNAICGLMMILTACQED
jgi:hypothetical protein